jgi:hypothetical protein
MATPSAGYKSKLGVAKETEWGTVVAPVEFSTLLPGESLNKLVEWAEKNVLKAKAGKEVADIIGLKASGGIKLEANYQATDLIWALIMGGVTTITGTGPYDHEFPLATDILRSLSTHIEKDVNVWSVGGVKINSATLACSPDTSPAELDIDCVAKDITQDTTHRAALAALVDPEIPRMLWHQAVLRIADDVDALQTTDAIEISNFNITVNNNLAIEQRDTTSGLYITEPLRNGRREILLTFTLPRYKADTFRDAQVAPTNLQADITFTSGAYIWKLELPTLLVKEFDAMAGDEGLTPVNVSLQAYRNDGNTFMPAILDECLLTITNDRDAVIWI